MGGSPSGASVQGSGSNMMGGMSPMNSIKAQSPSFGGNNMMQTGLWRGPVDGIPQTPSQQPSSGMQTGLWRGPTPTQGSPEPRWQSFPGTGSPGSSLSGIDVDQPWHGPSQQELMSQSNAPVSGATTGTSQVNPQSPMPGGRMRPGGGFYGPGRGGGYGPFGGYGGGGYGGAGGPFGGYGGYGGGYGGGVSGGKGGGGSPYQGPPNYYRPMSGGPGADPTNFNAPASSSGGAGSPRPYASDQPVGALGADVSGGINVGLTNALPGISNQIADLDEIKKLGGAPQEKAIRQYLDLNFDPFSQMVANSMEQRGYVFPQLQRQHEFDVRRGDLINQMTRGTMDELARRRANLPMPPPPPPAPPPDNGGIHDPGYGVG